MATGDSYYKLRENGTIGFAIIVVNEFDGEDHRSGTKAEIKMLEEIFSKLRFETIIFGEVTLNDFKDRMNAIRDNQILNDHDMIALAICSHGRKDEIRFPTEKIVNKNKLKLEACGVSSANNPNDICQNKECECEYLTVKEIQETVMSSYLKDKPKLIILNACRKIADAMECKSVGDRFTLFSTKLGQLSSKFKLKEQGFVPMFLRKLYEVINNQNPNDIFDSIADRINYTYDKDEQMKNKYEERSVLEIYDANKKLRLRLQGRLKKFDVLFTEKNLKEEHDSDVLVTGPNKELIIRGTSSATSIAYSNNDIQPCYYICDPERSKIIKFLAGFSGDVEITIDCELKSPRYIRCISHENFIFISHESGVIKVDISKGILENKHEAEKLLGVEEYISPCLAANENDNLLFILDRFSHSENNKMRNISVYNITEEKITGTYPITIEISPGLLLDKYCKYSPIINDMNFRQYNPEHEQQQLLILAYLPSPCLIIYTIGKKYHIEFTHHSEFWIEEHCEPCFIASFQNYTLMSCPKIDKSITKLNDEKINKDKWCTQLDIKNTQAVLIHQDGKAVITAIEDNNCLIYSWDGMTN